MSFVNYERGYLCDDSLHFIAKFKAIVVAIYPRA